MGGADACRGARGHPCARSTRPHTHPIQIGRRDHAAPNNWRRRVANVDHHQRVGNMCRHVSVGAAHGDAVSLRAQHVRASERECRRAGGRGGISGGGTAGASMMDGADASATRRSAVPSQPRSQNWVALTPARRDDDTTLPRITGDAGLLMSNTVSELE